MRGAREDSSPWFSSATEKGVHQPRAGYDSFDGKLRDELLEREIFSPVKEAEVLIEEWRQTCNKIRPHPPEAEVTGL